MATRDFHIGCVLSITTGEPVSPHGTAGVYDILNHMTGESLFTHQLPRAAVWARPILLAVHPQLAVCTPPLHWVDAGHVSEWVEKCARAIARHIEVEGPVPGWGSMDPLTELVLMQMGEM